MKKTTNFNLPTYEANDMPNLLDGYNNAMNIIDTKLQTATDDAVDALADANNALAMAQSNATNINKEVSRATAAEDDIEQNISDTADKIMIDVNANKNAISSEVSARSNADNTLQNSINSEASRAIAQENTLNALIANLSGSVPVFVDSISQMTDTTKVYVLKSTKIIYTYTGSNFSSTGVSYGEVSNAITSNNVIVDAGNYKNVLPDCNNAVRNTIYSLNFAIGSTDIPANLPFTAYEAQLRSLSINVLITFAPAERTDYIGAVQFLYTGAGYWTRFNTTNWSEWKFIQSFDYPYLVDSNNFETYLPDCDTAPKNKVISLNFASGDANIPKNLPWDKYVNYDYSQSINTLATYCPSETGDYIGAVQFLYCGVGYWVRFNTTNWNEWRFVSPTSDSIHVADLATLINYLDNTEGKTIYVEAGNYDFVDYYGDAYFNNYNSNTSHDAKGIPMQNTTLICSPAAIFTADLSKYTNTDLQEWWSMFNLTETDCKIVGLNATVNNCRYVVHDDPTNESTKTFMHEYINCTMINKTNSRNSKGSNVCLGGGLTKSANIVIDGCLFANSTSTLNSATEQERVVCSYHNSWNTSERSTITVKNCYCEDKSTIRVTWYGDSTLITPAIITNNSVGSEIVYRAEDSKYPTVNLKLYAWNNVVRS